MTRSVITPPWLSVIIPVRNEASRLAATLAPLQAWRARGVEVLVVDGGSSDGSPAVAAPLADEVLYSEPGRARQMNRGAAHARANWLWFLHADTQFGDAHIHALEACCRARRSGWAFFRVQLSGPGLLLSIVGRMMTWRARLTAVATGDQGLLVSRDSFQVCDGYPDIPLMEDVALCKQLRARSRPVVLGPALGVDSRRWETHGRWRTIVLMWRLRWAYWRGVAPAQLHARYYPGSDPSGDQGAADQAALVMLTRDISSGQAKTRLRPALGAAGAAAVHQALVARTLKTCTAGPWPLRCHVQGDSGPLQAMVPGANVTWLPQVPGDLGWRMQHALASAHAAGYRRVVLVGSDCAVLDSDYLSMAFAALAMHDFVLGPAEDGGYVLIGSARPSAWHGAPCLSGTRFGGAHALADTLTGLRALGSVALLPARWDVDDMDAVRRAREAGYL
ncbi:TIGR04283 family arsenosugar biosynthesis glycosyltransferase [Isoalcanivorax indicus]|uniref:TIGR04283 family arsenosugar biosynthesis glycosyltransferase n=1 Tax=Isoalcanivorax indicus TaxID=2202653 RepID=UPI0013C4E32A|nr:TIGR04283 family arsenosugar biosynthesis glycosyltransferase [Isoalcanivorax indicus]